MKILKNIYFRIISICLIILLVITGMIGVIGKEANKAIQKEYMNSLRGSFRSVTDSFAKEVENSLTILNIISVNEDVQRYLYNYDVLSIYEREKVYQDVGSVFSQFTYMNGIVKDIGVVKDDRSRARDYLEEEKPADFFPDRPEGILYEKDGRLFILQSERKKDKASTIFYIEINPDYLQKLSDDINAIVPETEVVWMEKDTTFYQNDGQIFEKKDLQRMQGEELTEEREYLNGSTKVFAYPIYMSSLKLYLGFENNLMVESAKNLDMLKAVVLLLIAIQAVLLTLYVYRVLNRPMKKLVGLMEEAGKGNLTLEVPEDRNDQFGFIFAGFRKMMKDLSNYIQITYNQRLEIEKSQLKQLQAQINPHFLYNCFFNISKLCKIEDMDTAALFSQKLATYYMYITRNSRDEVMLREEYQHASDYLEIQGIRFYNKVAVTMDTLTPEEERLRVPRIILQPVLENCYKYVFEKQEEKGKLEVHCIYDPTSAVLLLTIEDSGNRQEEELGEKIQEMNTSIHDTDMKRESTGTVNVYRRLKLQNAKNDMWAEKSALGGIKINIKIVYQRGEDECTDC